MAQQPIEPLDPNSPEGRDLAYRMTLLLDRIADNIADRERREAAEARLRRSEIDGEH